MKGNEYFLLNLASNVKLEAWANTHQYSRIGLDSTNRMFAIIGANVHMCKLSHLLYKIN